MSDTLDLVAAAEQARSPVPEAEEKPLTPLRVSLALNYDGERVVIEMQAMDGPEKDAAHRTAAILARGPWSNLPPMAQARFLGLGMYSQCFHKRPEWLDKAVGRDDDLLFSLVEQLEAHTSAYFRWTDGQGEGSEESPRFTLEVVR